MRKFVLALMMGTVVVAAVQAVTTGWQTTGKQTLTDASWTVATGGGNPTFDYAGGADFTAKVIYTFNAGTALSTGVAWASLFSINNAGTYYDFRTNDVGDAAKIWTNPGNVSDDTIRALIGSVEAGGTLELEFRYDHSEGTLGYYVEGTLLATKNGVVVNDWITLGAGQNIDGGSRPLDRIFPTDGSVSYEVLFLPEPTVLALMALGIAGAMLRRRAA